MILYGVYLTAEGETIRFPVNPQELSISYPSTNEKYNVLTLGEIIQPRKTGLSKISWEDGLLPARPDSSYTVTIGEFKTPDFYIDFIRRCKDEGLICTLTIDRHMEDGTPFKSDTILVVVEDFEAKEKGAETGDFYYSIELTEYRDYSPRAVSIVSTASSKTTAVGQKQRTVPKNQLVVGKTVKINGIYCYTASGSKPHGSGSGRTVVIGRILTGTHAYPVLVKTASGSVLGWCKKEVLTV